MNTREYVIINGNGPDLVYSGISENYNAADVIAIVLFDGEPEIWAMDYTEFKDQMSGAILDKIPTEESVISLKQYYQDAYSRQPESIEVFNRKARILV